MMQTDTPPDGAASWFDVLNAECWAYIDACRSLRHVDVHHVRAVRRFEQGAHVAIADLSSDGPRDPRQAKRRRERRRAGRGFVERADRYGIGIDTDQRRLILDGEPIRSVLSAAQWSRYLSASARERSSQNFHTGGYARPV